MGTSARTEDQPLQRRSVPLQGFPKCIVKMNGFRPGGCFDLRLVCLCNSMSPLFSGVCSLNNKLYVVGGSDPCGQKGLKNCDAFDPVTKTWSNCASLNIST